MPSANRPSITCPQCGAPIPIKSPAAVMAICDYCQTASWWDADAVHAAGVQSVLSEGFTRLYRGAGGALQGVRFEVVGRVRYRSAQALWDEWYLTFADGRTGWVTEDDHALCVQVPYPHDLSGHAGHGVGHRFELEGRAFEVDEVGQARCVGAAGELPEPMLTGEVYTFLDASSLDGELALGVELDATPPTSFLGRWLPHHEVALDDEGAAW